MGSGLEGLDFSHEGVKRVVGLLKGFVHAIASAPREFLYLRFLEINEYIIKKRKKKRKKKKTTLQYFREHGTVLEGNTPLSPDINPISNTTLQLT